MGTMDVGYALRILTRDACESIHQASLQILARTGVRFMDPAAVSCLRSGGAAVNDGDIVRIPSDLVEWAIKAAPRAIVLADRGGQPALRLERRNVYFGTGSDCPNILDSETGERRRFTEHDVAEGIRLCDALPNIGFVLSIGLVSDVPTLSSDVHQADAMLRNTVKPVVFTAHDVDNCRTIVDMAEAIAGGRENLRRAPHVAYFAEADSPLQFARETCRKLVLMAERGLPVIQGAGPMMGATGPQTHAGVLALANAEQLAGLVLLQLTKPSSPFICGVGVHPFDMRTGVLPYGAPELSLNTAAAAELAHYYRLPTWGYAGCSDAKIVDQQAAMEATSSVTMSLLSGANLVHDVGYLESGLTSSLEMIVLTDTIIEMGRAMLKEIEITDETLALDLIDRVGCGGDYLADEHTLTHFREVWYSDMIERGSIARWEEAGRPSMGDRLTGRVRDILSTHEVASLPTDVSSAVSELVALADTRARAAGRGMTPS